MVSDVSAPSNNFALVKIKLTSDEKKNAFKHYTFPG